MLSFWGNREVNFYYCVLLWIYKFWEYGEQRCRRGKMISMTSFHFLFHILACFTGKHGLFSSVRFNNQNSIFPFTVSLSLFSSSFAHQHCYIFVFIEYNFFRRCKFTDTWKTWFNLHWYFLFYSTNSLTCRLFVHFLKTLWKHDLFQIYLFRLSISYIFSKKYTKISSVCMCFLCRKFLDREQDIFASMSVN